MDTRNRVAVGTRPRALVIVRGGVAEVYSDNSVDVFLLDYDNDPAGEIPPKYLDLIHEE